MTGGEWYRRANGSHGDQVEEKQGVGKGDLPCLHFADLRGFLEPGAARAFLDGLVECIHRGHEPLDPIDDLDLGRYTPTQRFRTGPDTLCFEELRIHKDGEDQIDKIEAELPDVDLQVGAVANPRSISDVTGALGECHRCRWYDREQGLKLVQYKDRKNNLAATFVFSADSDRIVWVILEGGG